jgi:hypothetical protein
VQLPYLALVSASHIFGRLRSSVAAYECFFCFPQGIGIWINPTSNFANHTLRRVPSSQATPGPFSVVMRNPSPPAKTFMKPVIICTSAWGRNHIIARHEKAPHAAIYSHPTTSVGLTIIYTFRKPNQAIGRYPEFLARLQISSNQSSTTCLEKNVAISRQCL